MEAGQSVLCYDNVTGSVSHVVVSECRNLAGAVPWVSVTLTDGTSMTLTADHPVQPLSSSFDGHFSPISHNLGTVVKAADLQPGKDSLPVLRLLPTTVQNVEDITCVGSSTETGRVALSVEHPLRYSIFVGESGFCPDVQARVAVSSASLHGEGACGDENMVLQNTFLQQKQKRQLLRRCKSAPPGGCFNSMRNLQSDKQSVAFQTPKPSDSQVQRVCHDSDDTEQVRHGKSLGFKSTGSLYHVSGNCSLCVFENKYHHGQSVFPCSKGASCDFCHEKHESMEYKRKRKTGAMKRASRRE